VDWQGNNSGKLRSTSHATLCVGGCSENGRVPGQQLRDSSTRSVRNLVLVDAVRVLDCQGNS